MSHSCHRVLNSPSLYNHGHFRITQNFKTSAPSDPKMTLSTTMSNVTPYVCVADAPES